MAEITATRRNIHVEETDYRSAVAEAVLQKVGGSVNFINDKQYDTKAYFANGPYDSVSGAQTGVDGLYVCLFDMEIIGVVMFNIVAGTSGTTTFDVHRLTAPNTDAGTIFSTKPSIASTASSQAYVGFGPGGSIGGGTGMTAPVLSTTDLDAGDALRIDFDAKMSGAENAGLLIYIRPR
jgi:hypothetical protein